MSADAQRHQIGRTRRIKRALVVQMTSKCGRQRSPAIEINWHRSFARLRKVRAKVFRPKFGLHFLTFSVHFGQESVHGVFRLLSRHVVLSCFHQGLQSCHLVADRGRSLHLLDEAALNGPHAQILGQRWVASRPPGSIGRELAKSNPFNRRREQPPSCAGRRRCTASELGHETRFSPLPRSRD